VRICSHRAATTIITARAIANALTVVVGPQQLHIAPNPSEETNALIAAADVNTARPEVRCPRGIAVLAIATRTPSVHA
jgi:hypothetical protein